MTDRKYQNVRRRLKSIGADKGLPPLSNRESHVLSMMVQNIDGGVTDQDLQTIYRLTKRGLLGDYIQT